MSKPKIVLNIGTPIVLPPDVLKKAQQIEAQSHSPELCSGEMGQSLRFGAEAEWRQEKEQQKLSPIRQSYALAKWDKACAEEQKQGKTSSSHYKCIDR